MAICRVSLAKESNIMYYFNYSFPSFANIKLRYFS